MRTPPPAGEHEPPPPGCDPSPEALAAAAAAAAAASYSYDLYGQPYALDGQYMDPAHFMTPEEYAAFMGTEVRAWAGAPLQRCTAHGCAAHAADVQAACAAAVRSSCAQLPRRGAFLLREGALPLRGGALRVSIRCVCTAPSRSASACCPHQALVCSPHTPLPPHNPTCPLTRRVYGRAPFVSIVFG